jgi:DNA modification methylase
MINRVTAADALEGLQLLDSDSVDCIVTSPPYFNQRDYHIPGQIGLENTVFDYVSRLVVIFREARRVLKPGGTLWLNLGDSYSSVSGGYNKTWDDSKFKIGSSKNRIKKQQDTEVPAKNLLGVPWRVAFALQADGWYLRQDIIWHKPNPIPESVTDRCTKAHEYIFLLSKNSSYYFDNESIKEDSINKESYGERRARYTLALDETDKKHCKISFKDGLCLLTGRIYPKRNKRSVWTVPASNSKIAHCAQFPEALISPCIQAGCAEGGIVLDPFIGSGTTGIVALKLDRSFIGFDLNIEYVEIANNRLQPMLEQLKIF